MLECMLSLPLRKGGQGGFCTVEHTLQSEHIYDINYKSVVRSQEECDIEAGDRPSDFRFREVAEPTGVSLPLREISDRNVAILRRSFRRQASESGPAASFRRTSSVCGCWSGSAAMLHQWRPRLALGPFRLRHRSCLRFY